ncbi:MAG: glycosyltransferase family 4 protein [Phascolarctobacterium sp.]|nr:glycosyltransferase family 4 protein [Phascolarctobacterium sp.]
MSRILFLVPRMNIGGAETYVYTVAKELQSKGEYEVFVASAGGGLADELEKIGVKTFFVPVRFSRRFGSWIAVSMLKKIIKEYNIDVVHANSGDAGCIAAELKKAIDIPIVYTAHGVFGNIEREYVIDTLDRIICVSNFVKERALQQNFTESKLITRYCCIDTNRFTPDSSLRTELRKMYNIDKDTLVLATVSRIKNLEHKGHGALLEVFKKYAFNKNWKLIVVGKGNGLIQFKYKIKQAGLEDKIICLGHRNDVEKVLNIADVYVSPTQFETFGLAIAEGMAMEMPAVAYEIGGTSEVVNDGVSGFLVKYKDVQDLYEKINCLDTDRELLKQMSRQARMWVEDNFTIDKMVGELEEIYSDVLSK